VLKINQVWKTQYVNSHTDIRKIIRHAMLMLDAPTNASSRFNDEYFLNFDSLFLTVRISLADG
tara:strand:+ start:289 stop:477 length:189 start_codon:yes stop_codon:yes gene_type:complete